MRVLCVTQNTPSELEPLSLCLAKEHEVFMASSRRGLPEANQPLRRIQLKRTDAGKYERGYLGYLGLALKTAHNAQSTWEIMLERGDSPDIILACASNGLAFNLRQTFPAALVVAYPDSKLRNLLVRDWDLFAARRLIQEIQFAQSDLRFIRFAEEKTELDRLGKKSFHFLPLFVDTEFYAPAAQKKHTPQIIFMAGALSEQDMENLWKSLLACIKSNPEIHIFVVAENSLRKFPWQQRILSLNEDLARKIRVEFNLFPTGWRAELLASRLVFCPRADLPIRQRLLEALACGVPLLASQAFGKFKPGQNMLGLNPDLPAATQISNALACPDLLDKIGVAARQTVLTEHNMATILPGHIESLIHAWRAKNE